MGNKKENSKITIKKGAFTMVADRSSLAMINETSDGVTFEFKEGIHVVDADNNMPTHTKQRLKLNIDTITNGDVTVDLLNYMNPVSINFITNTK